MESTHVKRKDRKGRLNKKSLFPFRFEMANSSKRICACQTIYTSPQFPFQIQSIQFKMSSIKQLIVNAIIKVSGENPALDREGEPSAIEARDDFIKRLLAELFPEDPTVPVATPKKTKKTKKTKTEEVVVVKSDDDVPPPLEKVPEVEAEPAPEAPKKVKKTKKTEEAPVQVEVVTEAPATESPGKKKRAPMTEEAKAAMKAKRDATIAAKKAGEPVSPAEPVVETSGSNAAAGAAPAPEAAEPVKEKKVRKPKAEKPAEDSNLAKVDPTWRKHLKHADKDHAKDLEPELLKDLNALSKDDFNAKKAEEHVADFIASRVTKAVESDGKVEADLIVVDFNGKEYFVNPETKRVYEGEGTCDAEGNWTNYKGVGYVGMAAFADMTVDDE